MGDVTYWLSPGTSNRKSDICSHGEEPVGKASAVLKVWAREASTCRTLTPAWTVMALALPSGWAQKVHRPRAPAGKKGLFSKAYWPLLLVVA
jgi:hypothetical protein